MQTKRKTTIRVAEQADDKNRNSKSEAILRAAAKVFAQSGYFNAKVSDVARTAGASRKIRGGKFQAQYHDSPFAGNDKS